ncbi:MAG TPA: class I SAM-dependent methyltransferase [Anaerolineales bacterium]|nr:class I SAM-dependent methyltransferase [Anaerolineales bacterium]
MYDEFSADYDRFVDWEGRLAAEMPFIEQVLRRVGARRVLDAACGTGMHAVGLAWRGYEVVGADLSEGMVERARANAAAAGVAVRFEVAGFGELTERLGVLKEKQGNGEARFFDAVLCLGNSLPHVLAPEALHTALADFAACLRPGGVLLIQNLNYDRVLARQERWMDPQARREGDQEWLFLRFYDFDPDGLLTFNVVRLLRSGDRWEQQVMSTRIWPLRQAELAGALRMAGFTEVVCWGDMQGAPFDAEESPNLVIGGYK